VDVPDGKGKEISFGEGRDAFRIVVIRLGERLLAFHNRCPHFSLPLNYEPDKFHVFGGDKLMCAHHTAIFRLPEGHCIDGPCTGSGLTSIRIICEGGEIRIA
jgi:nitrite reductase/ring-hydroxylating ferredoxin subunit